MFITPLHSNLAISTHAERTESVLMALGTVMSLVIIWILVFDIPLFTQKHTLVPTQSEILATLRKTENSVRRKSGELPVWNTAQQSEALFLDDAIFVGDKSSAQIEFIDKSLVDVGQKSLVVVRRTEKQNLIELKRGTFNARFAKASRLVVEVNNVKSEISTHEASQIAIQTGSSGEAKISVLEGSVKLAAKDNEVVIQKNQNIDLPTTESGAKNLTVKENLLAILTPANLAEVKSNEAVTFKWQAPGKHEYLFELAAEEDFEKPLKEIKTSEQELELPALKPGNYFWRLRIMDEKKDDELLNTRKLLVSDHQPPTLIYPALGETVFLSAEKNSRTQLYLDWQQGINVAGYEIEMAREADFKDRQSFNVEHTPLLSPALEEGPYYWRVRTQGSQAWSAVGNFKLVRTQKSILAPPKLEPKYRLKPKKQGAWHFWFEDTAYAETGEDENTIEWEKIEKALSYDVQVASDRAFTSVVAEKNVTEARYTLENLKPGVYYLRIRSVQANGEKSDYSQPSVVYVNVPELQLLSPLPAQEVEKTGDVTEVEFTWQPVPGTDAYKFEVFKDKKLKNPIISEKIIGTRTVRKFTRAGIFFWRVSIWSGATDALDFSEVRELRMLAEGLKAPKLPTTFKVVSSKTTPIQTCEAMPAESADRLGIQMTFTPTKVESVSEDKLNREKLSYQAGNAVRLNVMTWVTQNLGAELQYAYLQTTLFAKDTPETAEPTRAQLQSWQANVKYRYAPTSAWPVYLLPKLGYSQTQFLSVQRADEIAIKRRTSQGPLLGLGLQAPLHRQWLLIFSLDHMFVLKKAEMRGKPRHLFMQTQLLFLLSESWHVGGEYAFSEGKYAFKNDVASKGDEKYSERRESLGLVLGWSI